MLEKMGWRPGEGLGKDATGNLEPLMLDVKSDRKGLIAEEEMSIKQRNKINAQNNVPVDLSSWFFSKLKIFSNFFYIFRQKSNLPNNGTLR